MRFIYKVETLSGIQSHNIFPNLWILWKFDPVVKLVDLYPQEVIRDIFEVIQKKKCVSQCYRKSEKEKKRLECPVMGSFYII